MSLYKETESKMEELDKIICQAKDTNNTLNESARYMGDALKTFSMLNDDIQKSLKSIADNHIRSIELHQSMVTELSEIKRTITSESSNTKNEIHKIYDHVNQNMTSLQTSINTMQNKIEKDQKKTLFASVLVVLFIVTNMVVQYLYQNHLL